MDLNIGELRTIGVGFASALAVLFVLFFVVGIGEILAALSMARSGVLLAVLVVAITWLTAWSLALRTVLGVLGIPTSTAKAFLVFASATFANNITPFGQAGGEPFSALLISRATDSEYETGLAAIASVDALNFIPSITLALVGVSYYAAAFTLGRRIEVAALGVLALALAIPLVIYVGWQRRKGLRGAAVRVFTPVGRAVARVVPRFSAPDPARIRRRVDGFYRAIGRIAGNRRKLLVALSFSAAGWVLLATSLWLSLYALGHAVPVAVVLFVIPVGSIAGVTPLPGGLGGVEAALVLLLGATTGLDPATASAAVVIHRGATYLLPVLIGGGAVTVLEAGNAHP